MTAIAGLVEDGKVWIGGDSAGISGANLCVRKDPKVFLVGEVLIGFTESFRMGQLLRYFLSPSLVPDDVEPMDYMVRQFIPGVRTIFKDHGYLEIDNNREAAGEFLVGMKGRLFHVDCDFAVGESRLPYDACGCGEDFVRGVLYATDKRRCSAPPPAPEKIGMALDAAEAMSAGVRGPWTVLSV